MLREPWRLELLGRTELRYGEAVYDRFRERKIVSLLAVLCLSETHTVGRDQLIEILWPDESPDLSRNRFRVTLYRVRQLIEPPGVEPGSVVVLAQNSVSLRMEAITCDARDFLNKITLAETAGNPDEEIRALERAVALYRGDLMPGFDDPWAENQRERLANTRYHALRKLTRGMMGRSAGFDRALPHARVAVSIEPYDEEAHCDLIRLYGATGQFSQAIAQYEALEALLKRDLDAKPSPQARRLARMLSERIGHAVRSDARGANPEDFLVGADGPAESESGPAGDLSANQQPPSSTPATDEPKVAARLPVYLSRYFGRQETIEAVTELLSLESMTRIVSLLGPGGAGKTRLSLEVAKRLLTAYSNRAHFVALADLFSVQQVPDAILTAIALTPDPSRDSLSQVIEALQRAPALLIFDNAEHLLPDLRDLLLALLKAIPTVRCVVSTRRSIAIEGAQEIQIGTLTVPGEGADASVLPGCSAVALFLDRARAVRSDFGITESNARDIGKLCRFLEGMPLSIELAAARLRVMSVKEMVSQMSASLNWLVDPRGSKETRHRSLRTSIEWSCRLLAPPHREALNVLALFAGGFRAEAAMHLCSSIDDPGIATLDMLDELTSASLISTAEDAAGITWFRMVEALRGFALEQLARSGCEQSARLRHLNWCLGLAGQAGTLAASDPSMKELDANWRSALEFGLSESEPPEIQAAGIQLAEALTPYWLARGSLTEGRDWLRRSLHLSIGDEMRMRLSSAQAILAVPQGDYAEAEQMAAEAIALASKLGDSRHIAINQSTLGQIAFRQGRYPESTERSEKALELHRALGDTGACIECLKALGMTAWYESNHRLAQVRIEEGLYLARELGNRHAIADALLKLGNIARDEGDRAKARPLLDEALLIFRELDVPRDIGSALHDLGLLHIASNHETARAYFQEAYRYFHEIGIRSGFASCVHNLGQLFLLDGRLAEAKEYTEDALSIYRSLGDRRNISASLHNLAVITERQGDYDRAMPMLLEAAEFDEQIGNRQGLAVRGMQIALNRLSVGDFDEAERWVQSALKIDLELRAWPLSDSLLASGWLALERSHPGRALQLAAAATTWRESLVAPSNPEFMEITGRIRSRANEALGEPAADALWREGLAMSPEEALAARSE